jgi:hypothetical protein
MSTHVISKTRELLHVWERFCEQQSKMHDTARAHYKFYNYMIAIPAILLTTISGAGSLGISSEHNDVALSYVMGSLSLTAGAMFSIHRYMNIPELQHLHDFYGDEFLKLRNNIRLHLVITDDEDNKTFSSLVEFSKHIKTILDNCIDKSPSLPPMVVGLKKKSMGKKFYSKRMFNDYSYALSNVERPDVFCVPPKTPTSGEANVGAQPTDPPGSVSSLQLLSSGPA